MFKIIAKPRLAATLFRFSSNFEVKIGNFHHGRRNYHILNGKRSDILYFASTVRCMSDKTSEIRVAETGSVSTSTNETVFQNLPEPPALPPTTELVSELVPEGVLEQVSGLAEPSLASLGLAGWTPAGIVQSCLEFLHITCDIPWWGTIVIGTIVVRVCMFPLVIMSQRNSARMSNSLPQMQVLQSKMTEARQSGNSLDAARYAQELMLFMKEKGVNPLKNMMVPFAQAPVFISFFVGLRGMSNCPVESMMAGGMFWFTDLTVPDPYYILPLITSTTLLLTIELGADGARLDSTNLQTMRYVIRAIPFIMLPVTINFSGAILCYWVSSNFISLAQVAFLKIPKVRQYFGIPAMIKHAPESLAKKKGFVAGIKDNWTNMKLTKEFEDRRRVDELIFNKSGKGPLQKTYKYDPTMTSISAKKDSR